MTTRDLARPGVWILAMAALVAVVGCDSDDGTTAEPTGGPIEVVGTFGTDFGVETVTETMWNDATIADYDNGDNWAVTQNPPDAPFAPDGFNALVWTEPAAGTFYYCTYAFGLGTEAEAKAADRSQVDASDLEGAGCGGQFAWTKMTPQ